MQALLIRLTPLLPLKLRDLATPERIGTLVQFLKFGVVGAIGFVIDTSVVYGLRASLGLYGAGAVSYVVAASINWGLNRAWTFRGQGTRKAHHQWALFLATNLAGFALNRGAYALLVTFSALCYAQPVYAVAAGSLAGMFVNFGMARSVVFR